MAAVLLGAMLGLAGPVSGHHVGTYTPGDNDISANFKQLKFAIQAAKFDVARRLFEDGALRQALLTRADRWPPGLEEATREAFATGDAARAETSLVIVLAGLTRDLALEADHYLVNPREPRQTRAAAAEKFLGAMWRYYNLIDFAVSQRDPKASTAIRLAFDEAAAPRAVAAPVRSDAPDPTRMRAPIRRIADTLAHVIETLTPSTRRKS